MAVKEEKTAMTVLSYKSTLELMQDAVVQGQTSAAGTLFIEREEFPVREQLHIYRHGYEVRLQKVVRADYPALAYYVGEEVMNAWVAAYVKAQPSHHYNLDTYPFRFAAFVSTLTEDRFAIELAALEGAIKQVYMMPESPPLTPDQLAAEGDITARVIGLRKASLLLGCDYPVNAYLAAFRAGENPVMPAAGVSRYIIYRHQHNVKRRECSETEYALLHALQSHKPLAVSMEGLHHLDAGEVQQAFALFVQSGMLSIL